MKKDKKYNEDLFLIHVKHAFAVVGTITGENPLELIKMYEKELEDPKKVKKIGEICLNLDSIIINKYVKIVYDKFKKLVNLMEKAQKNSPVITLDKKSTKIQ